MTAVDLGPVKVEEIIRTALGMGADRGIHVAVPYKKLYRVKYYL